MVAWRCMLQCVCPHFCIEPATKKALGLIRCLPIESNAGDTLGLGVCGSSPPSPLYVAMRWHSGAHLQRGRLYKRREPRGALCHFLLVSLGKNVSTTTSFIHKKEDHVTKWRHISFASSFWKNKTTANSRRHKVQQLQLSSTEDNQKGLQN